MASEQATAGLAQKLQTIVIEHRDSPPSPSIGSHDEGSQEASTVASSTSYNMPNGIPGQPLWTHRVSASFNAMAEQINAASRAIALIPPLPDTQYANLSARMDDIEASQKKIEGDLAALKEHFTQMTEGPEKFQKQLDDHIAAFKLEQQRLPARLHNALVTINKSAIKPVVMANGKFPPQFPATRGEFEHLTKERYEFLLKSYGLPITGDTAAKRDALRSFVGLPTV